MGIREYDFDGYNDIENQRKINTKRNTKDSITKNNEELDRIFKNICLCIGWTLVFILFCWVIYLYLLKV